MINRNKLFLWAFVICAVGFFFGYVAGQGNARISSKLVVSRQSSAVSIMLDYGNGTVRTYTDLPITAGMSVLDITKALLNREKIDILTKDYGEMGMLVTQIGPVKNGSEGKYWQIWVNNSAVQTSADKKTIQAGDVIEWKFLNYK